eukprot:m.8968 g.8968  ORF g.8968 m.8968 type:complete len:429 (+) comp6786_c0_seq1:991-2277(+)
MLSLGAAIMSRGGVKIGIIGLAENWLVNCPIEADSWIYLDMFTTGEAWAKKLKGEMGCDVVLALTHNRLARDRELTKRCPSIDLLLGGHDHFFKQDLKHRIIKSGQEFEYLTRISILIGEDGSKKIETKIDSIDPSDARDPEMDSLISRYEAYIESKYGKVLGTCAVPLDSRESALRYRECNFANFICDCVQDKMESHVKRRMGTLNRLSKKGTKGKDKSRKSNASQTVDFTIINAGGMKGNTLLKAGAKITLGDLMRWFPGDSQMEALAMHGAMVKDFLEYCCKTLSADGTGECGAFPHCSKGLSFEIDATKPIGRRVSKIRVHRTELSLKKTYVVGVTAFAGSGRMFKGMEECARVVDDECGIDCANSTKRFFTARGYDDEVDTAAGDLGVVDTDVGRITHINNTGMTRKEAKLRAKQTKRFVAPQ